MQASNFYVMLYKIYGKYYKTKTGGYLEFVAKTKGHIE